MCSIEPTSLAVPVCPIERLPSGARAICIRAPDPSSDLFEHEARLSRAERERLDDAGVSTADPDQVVDLQSSFLHQVTAAHDLAPMRAAQLVAVAVQMMCAHSMIVSRPHGGPRVEMTRRAPHASPGERRRVRRTASARARSSSRPTDRGGLRGDQGGRLVFQRTGVPAGPGRSAGRTLPLLPAAASAATLADQEQGRSSSVIAPGGAEPHPHTACMTLAGWIAENSNDAPFESSSSGSAENGYRPLQAAISDRQSLSGGVLTVLPAEAACAVPTDPPDRRARMLNRVGERAGGAPSSTARRPPQT